MIRLWPPWGFCTLLGRGIRGVCKGRGLRSLLCCLVMVREVSVHIIHSFFFLGDLLVLEG